MSGCDGGTYLSPAQLRDLAASAGFPDPVLAAAVAMVESYGCTVAENFVPPSKALALSAAGSPQGPEWSLGIWQINNCASWQGDTCASPRYDPAVLYDPTRNAQIAFALWQARGWQPWWTTIHSGAYKQYLPADYVPVIPPLLTPAPAQQPQQLPAAYEVVTPPSQNDAGSVALVTVGALALAAVAGYAVKERTQWMRA